VRFFGTLWGKPLKDIFKASEVVCVPSRYEPVEDRFSQCCGQGLVLVSCIVKASEVVCVPSRYAFSECYGSRFSSCLSQRQV
jgi:hypothetical protein